ncbi:MAG: hypothetical protein UV70_C0001G0016 [Parcubacteria group bacterium GW2011_GWA2_43_13]|nr:MAG: hypothetical protein UV70_C0001G0016 [Parcubacteria group bacterium GW2011_GWA2_43_13]
MQKGTVPEGEKNIKQHMKCIRSIIVSAGITGAVTIALFASDVHSATIQSFKQDYRPQVISGDRITLRWQIEQYLPQDTVTLSVQCPKDMSISDMLGLRCNGPGFNVGARTQLYGIAHNTSSTAQIIPFTLSVKSGADQRTVLLSVEILPKATERVAIGDFVKSSNSQAVYYVTDDLRLSVVPHESVFYAYGYKDFNAVKPVSLSDFETTNPLAFPDGTLFRGTEKSVGSKDRRTVFVVENGQLRPIISAEVYQKIYNDPQWKRVIWIPDDVVEKFHYEIGADWTENTAIPAGTLIKSGNDYYRIEKFGSTYSKKKLSGTLTELTKKGIDTTRAISVMQSLLATFTDGGVDAGALPKPRVAKLQEGFQPQKIPFIEIVRPNATDVWHQEGSAVIAWTYRNLQESATTLSFVSAKNEILPIGTVPVSDGKEERQEYAFQIQAQAGMYTLRVCNGDVCVRREKVEIRKKVLFQGQLVTIEEITGLNPEYRQGEKISLFVRVAQAPELSQLGTSLRIAVHATLVYGSKENSPVLAVWQKSTNLYALALTAPKDTEGTLFIDVTVSCSSSNDLCSTANEGYKDTHRISTAIISGALELTAPVSGSEIVAGSSVAISWKGGSGDKAKILLKSSWYPQTQTIIADDIGVEGSFLWNVPSDMPTGDYVIEVIQKKASGTQTGSVSTSIRMTGSTISIAPIQTAVFVVGDTLTVTWPAWFVGTSVTKVFLRLDKGGKVIKTISSSAENIGSYAWVIPVGLTASNEYSINIAPTNSAKGVVNTRNFTINQGAE